MKKFSCGDVVSGCKAKFEAKSEDEILAQVAAHAKADHGLETVSPDLVASVKAKISDAAHD